MYEPSGRNFPNLIFLWPAFVAAAASEFAALAAKQFANLAIGRDGPAVREPKWATPNTVALELKTVRLRDFSTEADGSSALLCAPFALHGAAVVDFAPGHIGRGVASGRHEPALRNRLAPGDGGYAVARDRPISCRCQRARGQDW